MNGSALAVDWAKQHVPAIQEACYPGKAGGQAIGETLSGKNDSGGKLPVTFYAAVKQLPPFADYSMKNRTYRYFAESRCSPSATASATPPSTTRLNGTNVNASPQVLTPAMIAGLARLADALPPSGVRLAISVDLHSPEALGGLDTSNPKDPQVIRWWQDKVAAIYKAIPDFAGFTVKTDSEGQPGPSQYGLGPTAAANMLAHALAPHGGVVMYRAFLYSHHPDWHDPKADRARGTYDIFHPLDGKFASNAVIQIKNGPIDVQVREPVSPLFAGLRKPNQAIELEVPQEYIGQPRLTVDLVPMWRTTLDVDMHARRRHTPVKDIVAGRSFGRPLGGYAAVVIVGLESNWLHDPLAMANLWSCARLARNPDPSARGIAENRTHLTFSNAPEVVPTLSTGS